MRAVKDHLATPSNNGEEKIEGRERKRSGRTPTLLPCSPRALRRMKRERPGALLARRTRTMKLCSSDARSRGQPWPLPPILGKGNKERGMEGRERNGGLAIPCVRATRGLRRPSLNARTMGKRQAALSNTGRGMKRR
jgi:hypothetical protein